MPLPAALLARLAKRGIIQDVPVPSKPNKPAEEVEEVFAEDYDDPDKPEVPKPESIEEPEKEDVEEKEEEADDTEYVHEVTACPNRSNPYHTCVRFCKKRWGMKTFNPDSDMLRRRERMLRKYPLPDGWKEVADPDTGRYYYWSLQTEQVCWLSPGHPKAVISMSAEVLSGIVNPDLDDEFEDQEDEPMEDEPMEAESEMSGSSSDSDSEEDMHISRREPERPPVIRQQQGRSGHWQDDRRGGRRGGRPKRDEIDPMDPAAYSDIPRGGWTDGLDTRGAAKTGVDVTASGPLFQQRPYPSPGDILRANQSLKK